MEDDIVIRIRGMSKSYTIVDPSIESRFAFKKKTKRPIFDDVDLDVRKGDIVGVIGRNGCGKSTFLKLVSGILEPDSGTIEVKGKVASILELSMGFHGDLSGRENIILRSELYGIPRDEVLANIDSIIEYTDLGVYIDNPVRTYSSGMRSRLAFSVMVNVDADIFLVDEALSTGDMAFASKASEHLKNLVRSGKTVLFTSHSLGTIKGTCNRAIWLSDRTIKMDGDPEDVAEAYTRSINDSFDETLHLANDGSSSAQYRLYTFYRDGRGVEMDPAEARRWLEAAALREHPMALADLADILMSEGKEEEALAMFGKAAECGNYEARRKYATLQSDTLGEIEELREIMKSFCDSGYPSDYYNYGNLMFRSAISAGDRREALEYLKKASELGWSDADVLLGQMYRDGIGAERNPAKCIEYLSRAAENGHPKAMYMLGDLYSDGKYIEKDQEQAFKWYLMSAYSGNARSQYQVAQMLASGTGTERDDEESRIWFGRYSSSMVNDSRRIARDILASRRGDIRLSDDLLKSMSLSFDPRSMTALASKYRSGKGFKKSPDGALDLQRKAALAGGAPRTRLAEMLIEDNGGKCTKEAFDLIASAAAMGDSSALLKLAYLYRDGECCEPDLAKYRMYMRMAAEHGNRDAKKTVIDWRNRTERRRSKKASGSKEGNKEK